MPSHDLNVFKEYDAVLAGFTRKPDTDEARRQQMISDMKSVGGAVIKPILVHGNEVAEVNSILIGDRSYVEIPETDGVVTNIPNVVLTTTHADCIPVYAYDPVKKVIGLAHAGWKGTASGITMNLIDKMVSSFECNPRDIIAYIGPGICKEHFKFGKDYAKECFTSKYAWMQDYIKEASSDKVTIDLKGINEHFFKLAGVGAVQICSECTYCDDRYYSYRRAKDTERMLAYISISKEV